MVIRYIIALLLTVALLGVARRTSTRHSERLEVSANGIKFTHETVTESFGETPLLKLSATSTSTVRAIVSFSETGNEPYRKMEMAFTSYGYITDLPALEKGKKWYYHIDAIQNNVNIAQLPSGKDQFIKFKGHVSPSVLIPHIFFMFATIFFGILAVFTAIDYGRGKGMLKSSVCFIFLTLISAFLGGFPFGIAVTYQTFGESWGGWPIGKDFTDTKTEIFFLFWLVTCILSWKGLEGNELKISPRTYATLVVISFAVTLITFLIPHSI